MKNLTLRYSVTQFAFWAASTGAVSFAATYLFSRGLASGYVGTLLAAAGLLSCVSQPLLASAADRAGKWALRRMLMVMSVLCLGCFVVPLCFDVPVSIVGLCYMAGIWSSDAMVPLLNALYVSCTQAGYRVSYGVSRGVGAVASAVASLVIGFVLAEFGGRWMLLVLVALRILCVGALMGFPKTEHCVSRSSETQGCSVLRFFSRYGWYCASLIGILCMGMFLSMAENYLIAVMQRLGGDSSHVGTALFIAAMAAAPVIFWFERIRKHIQDRWLLLVASCAFLLRAILLYIAGSIKAVWGMQLLHAASYGLLAPAQVHYAKAKVRQEDMVKGQAFITAAYALGCSAGNFVGGQLLRIGVDAMLTAGIGISLAGVIVLAFTVNKTDR